MLKQGSSSFKLTLSISSISYAKTLYGYGPFTNIMIKSRYMFANLMAPYLSRAYFLLSRALSRSASPTPYRTVHGPVGRVAGCIMLLVQRRPHTRGFVLAKQQGHRCAKPNRFSWGILDRSPAPSFIRIVHLTSVHITGHIECVDTRTREDDTSPSSRILLFVFIGRQRRDWKSRSLTAMCNWLVEAIL